MASTVPPRDWTEIHWPDIAKAGAKAGAKADTARWIAVLPLAATEQHGPHLPLETDVLIGEAYLARVRELLPVALPVTFLPLQPVGISTEHIDYPGTLTLPTDVALKEWMAIGESVAQAGIRKLVIVTSHGGNSAAMSLVAQDLRAHHGLLVVTTSWSRFGAPDGLFSAEEIRHGIHGGAVETSIMLARYPHTVRKEAIADFRPPASRWSRNFVGSRRIGRSPSRGRRRICMKAARSATPPTPPRRKANNFSITARARSANCSMTSTNSIRNCFVVSLKRELIRNYL